MARGIEKKCHEVASPQIFMVFFLAVYAPLCAELHHTIMQNIPQQKNVARGIFKECPQLFIPLTRMLGSQELHATLWWVCGAFMAAEALCVHVVLRS